MTSADAAEQHVGYQNCFVAGRTLTKLLATLKVCINNRAGISRAIREVQRCRLVPFGVEELCESFYLRTYQRPP
jgi:hypothetical protein